jgi:hypothetical protein
VGDDQGGSRAALLRASLLVSPRPTALFVRKAFARSGKELAASLASLEPEDIVSVLDERYGPHVAFLDRLGRGEEGS